MKKLSEKIKQHSLEHAYKQGLHNTSVLSMNFNDFKKVIELEKSKDDASRNDNIYTLKIVSGIDTELEKISQKYGFK